MLVVAVIVTVVVIVIVVVVLVVAELTNTCYYHHHYHYHHHHYCQEMNSDQEYQCKDYSPQFKVDKEDFMRSKLTGFEFWRNTLGGACKIVAPMVSSSLFI